MKAKLKPVDHKLTRDRPRANEFNPKLSAEKTPTDHLPSQEEYERVRKQTERLCETLETEDFVLQAMEDVSPVKWHLAHTAWFFEAFILETFVKGYRPIDPHYCLLFNSYYNSVSPQWDRPKRGLLSRPTISEVFKYRRLVDEQIFGLLETIEEDRIGELAPLMVLGLHHEQQHQELLLTDIKYNFSINPLKPALLSSVSDEKGGILLDLQWIPFEGGTFSIGHDTSSFCFDNEKPCHQVLLQDFQLANRLTTCSEYLDFVEDGGYQRPELWLSDGWSRVQEEEWRAPLYWEKVDDSWHIMTLAGLRRLQLSEPVCHVSHYEANAFATWAGKRLPTEFEWEVAASESKGSPTCGNFADSLDLHPKTAAQDAGPGLHQLFGDAWEWTSSAYLPYPRYRPPAGAVGEYNGKFMSGQMVLRGGSTATPRGHIRPTYRNFFQPEKRWQFSGIRLAEDG